MLKLVSSLALAVFLLAPSAFADDANRDGAGAPTPMVPAPPPPRPDAMRLEYSNDPPMTTERRVGIGLTVSSAVFMIPAGLGTFVAFGIHGICDDGPCPQPVSKGAKAAIVVGDGVLVGALVTGIVLIVDGARPASETKRASARIRPTADGVAFAF
jgi:hypothetical protein